MMAWLCMAVQSGLYLDLGRLRVRAADQLLIRGIRFALFMLVRSRGRRLLFQLA